MNCANVNRSQRLRSCLNHLLDGPKTSLELSIATGSVAPHTDVSELRANGIQVNCKYVGKSALGRKVYEYSL